MIGFYNLNQSKSSSLLSSHYLEKSSNPLYIEDEKPLEFTPYNNGTQSGSGKWKPDKNELTDQLNNLNKRLRNGEWDKSNPATKQDLIDTKRKVQEQLNQLGSGKYRYRKAQYTEGMTLNPIKYGGSGTYGDGLISAGSGAYGSGAYGSGNQYIGDRQTIVWDKIVAPETVQLKNNYVIAEGSGILPEKIIKKTGKKIAKKIKKIRPEIKRAISQKKFVPPIPAQKLKNRLLNKKNRKVLTGIIGKSKQNMMAKRQNLQNLLRKL